MIPLHSLLINMLLVLTILRVPYTSSFTQFIFGDSLVDAGNNDYIFTLSRADSPPYGIDFVPSGGRPTGRFTNGRTITDIIGQALGPRWFPPPYLAPSTSDGALFKGINYASGSSGILDESGTLFIGRVPLRQQVDYFKQSRAHMERMAGESSTKEILKTAIFSITSGSNDILDYIQPLIPFLGEDKVSPGLLHDFMISNLTIQLKRLHTLGARKFIVVGVGPLGCIPFVRALKLISNGRCAMEANELTQGYNKKLVKLLSGLNQEFGPEAIFVYANSYNILIDIIRNYRHYGFARSSPFEVVFSVKRAKITQLGRTSYKKTQITENPLAFPSLCLYWGLHSAIITEQMMSSELNGDISPDKVYPEKLKF
ncbi:hypothetical protein Sjap_005682 [Stephania japonica]|uniref:GDSL esterase/lipase n=1 Tax=Stephania japonica TaxID=461633 RepID=A0AAP0PKC7_9MAGN